MSYSAPMKQSSLLKSSVVAPVALLPLDVDYVEGGLTGADVILYGVAVSLFGGSHSDEVLEALSWVLLNRRAVGHALDPLQLPHRAPDDWIETTLNTRISPEVAHAVSIFARVVSGSVIEPVRGATRFHSHRETPSWAEQMDLRAIIGPYLFYAADR